MRGNMVLPTPLQAFSGMPKAAATTEKQTIVDGAQSLRPEQFVEVSKAVNAIRATVAGLDEQ